MVLFPSIWLLIVVILSFIKTKWSIALFISYLILVPGFNLNFIGLGSGQNLIILILLASYFYMCKRYKIKQDWKPFSPFIVYFILTLIVIPFQNGEPFLINIDYWRRQVIDCLIIPFMVWNIICFDPKSYTLFQKTILICISISTIYGLCLTQLEGINPYIIYITNVLDLDVAQNMERYYLAEGEGRFFGRISSVFIHPMTFALFIGFSIIYLYFIRNRLFFTNRVGRIVFVAFFIISILMALFCGVRSILVGLLASVLYYLYTKHSAKSWIFSILSVTIVISSLLLIFPEISGYLSSLFDFSNKSEAVKGSSFAIRLSQVEGAIDIISDNPLFGKGNGWTSFYQLEHGDHPVCLAFESLIIVIICNYGIMGFFIWGLLIYHYYKFSKIGNDDSYMINTLMVFYITYSIITGEYGYMRYFTLFFVLMLGLSKYKCSENY